MFTIKKMFTIVVTCSVFLGCSSNSDNEGSGSRGNTPNILFFILDDVGIDQMQSFGYGGTPLQRPLTSIPLRMPV